MEWLFRVLFPNNCRGCGSHGNALCANCILRIPLAKPTEHRFIDGIFSYEDPLVRAIMYDCKYHQKTAAYESLANAAIPYIQSIIGDIIMSEYASSITLVPIPLSKNHRSRGFNQAHLAARIIANGISGAYITTVLKRVKTTVPQTTVQKKSLRLINVKGSMKAVKELSPKSIYLVIDDITTTGATFLEARRALRESGARSIFCIALAHGFRGDK